MVDPKQAKVFYRTHPELKAYSQEKRVLMDKATRVIVEFAARLPDNPDLELTGNEQGSVAQQNILDYTQQQTPSFGFWQAELPEVTTILQNYWFTGEEIPSPVTKNLDYQAYRYGYQSGDDLLPTILISMNQ